MRFHLEPPPGFQGFRPDLPVTCYRRNLPHLRQDGATYFVTFRLGDSLPAQALQDINALREEWEREHPAPHTDEELQSKVRAISAREEAWLDQGHGSCLLAQQAFREPVERLFHEKSRRAVELSAYVIMPITPLPGHWHLSINLWR